MKKIKTDPYAKAGVDYNLLDAVKKLAQEKSISTAKFLKKVGFSELSESRGESAFVWQQGGLYMAAILECLGTKNLVADEMYKITGKTYYDVIAQDTVATAINDLTALGAKPLTLHAFWGLWNDDWLLDKKRTEDFVKGWERACALAGVTWGGGETPSLTNVVAKGAVVLAASAVGIIKPKSRLMRGNKIKVGDRIVFLKSTGLNANGISLARAVAKKLPKGYATKLPSGKMYGEAVLTKTNIYAKIIQELLDGDVDIHYISNITGHGLRKIMRARQDYTYVVEKTFEPQEVFFFIQKHANLSDFEMYQTFNMGSDYALFLPAGHVKKAQEIVKKNGFKSLDAGYVRKGKRQVIIEPKNLTFKSKTLDLR